MTPIRNLAINAYAKMLHWLYELSGRDYRYCSVCPLERECYDDPYCDEADDDYYEDEDDIHWRWNDEPL